MLVEKSKHFRIKKKRFVNKTRLIIFNLKLLPFLKNDIAIEFYKKIKDEFESEEYELFFDYFENTWMKINEENNVKFVTYYGKFDFKKNRNKIIKDTVLDEYVFCSNNACESVNNLINNFIQINSQVSLSKFETIIKTLFIRLECNRSNANQKSERIIHKQVLSDVLLELINLWKGDNLTIIRADQFNKLKNKPNEKSIFKIMEPYLNDNDLSGNEEDDENQD